MHIMAYVIQTAARLDTIGMIAQQSRTMVRATMLANALVTPARYLDGHTSYSALQ